MTQDASSRFARVLGSHRTHDLRPAQIAYAGTLYESEYAYDLRTAREGAPGEYGLCAAHNPAGPADYFRLGTFVLYGPNEATFLCNLGEPCFMTVTGVGLQSENSVLIFSNDPNNAGVEIFLEGMVEQPLLVCRSRC